MNKANAQQEALKYASNFHTAKSCLIDASVFAAAFNINAVALANFNGLRMYFGLKYQQVADQATNNDGTKTLEPFVVADDDKGNDIVGKVNPNISTNSLIFNHIPTCPDLC